MWAEKITFEFYGDNFSPTKFLGELDESVLIVLQHESTDENDVDPSGMYGYGGLLFHCPRGLGVQHFNLQEYEAWYIDFLEMHGELMRLHGIDDIRLFVDVFHDDGQLNTEVFSNDGLKTIAKFNAAIPLSYHRLEREEIIALLKKSDLAAVQIEEYVATHPIGA